MDVIQNMLQQLRQTYIAEIPTRLDDIEQLIMAIERSGYAAPTFNELYRFVHSLKGSGGTYGVNIITTICHPFEDYLSTTSTEKRNADKAFTNIALQFVDLLREAATSLGQGDTAFEEIESKLSILRLSAFVPQQSALIIETSKAGVNFIVPILDKFNCRMVLMNDGYAALGRLLAEPFHLIITSLENPFLNGCALIAAIKLTKGPNLNTECILLTTTEKLHIVGPKPDYILQKNASMPQQLETVIESIFREKMGRSDK